MEILDDIVDESIALLVDNLTYPFPGLWGWLCTAGLITSYTIWAKKTKHTTMSRTLWYYKDFKTHPKLAPAIIGGWLYLTYHLLVEDYLRNHRNRLTLA